MSFLIKILSYLPLRVLYAIMQTVLYPLAFYVIRYRRKVVRTNMTNSFPEKSAKEISALEKRFYHWFCDLIAEIIYGYRVSEEEMVHRVRIKNQAELEPYIRQYGGCIVMLAHLGCWEWIADAACRWTDGIRMDFIYRRLKSKSADKVMIELRHKRGGGCIEMKSLLRQMVRDKNDDLCHVYGMLSDQKPSKNDLNCWVSFLHQDTPFITGTEKLARRFNLPVFYIEIHYVERGIYELCGRLICEDSASTEEGYITRTYAKMLEENIKSDPHMWLWTHKRFKYKKA